VGLSQRRSNGGVQQSGQRSRLTAKDPCECKP